MNTRTDSATIAMPDIKSDAAMDDLVSAVMRRTAQARAITRLAGDAEDGVQDALSTVQDLLEEVDRIVDSVAADYTELFQRVQKLEAAHA